MIIDWNSPIAGFKTVTDAAICLTFNIAVLLSSHVQDPSSDNMFYISSDLLVVALFAVNFIVPASLVAHEIRKFYGERLIGSFSNTSTADEAAQAAKEPSDAHAPVNPTADLMQVTQPQYIFASRLAPLGWSSPSH